jgi:mRNA interferase MazF
VPRWPALLLEAARDVRLLEADPSKRNGLQEVSQITIDKIIVVHAVNIGGVIGEASDALLLRVNRALALFLGIV